MLLSRYYVEQLSPNCSLRCFRIILAGCSGGKALQVWAIAKVWHT